MTTYSLSAPRPARRRLGLGLIAALHLALLYGWRLEHPPHARVADDDGRGAIQWLTFAAAPSRPAMPHARTRLPTPPAGASAPVPRAPAAVPPHAAPADPAPTVTVAPPLSSPLPLSFPPTQPPAAAAPPSRGADDILQQARRDIGRIDRDLRRQYHEPLATAPADTPQKRMERGFAEAAAAVPNRWYEAAKITEMVDQGGRKIYKVVGAGGTYCVYADPNQAPGGETFQHGGGARTATCPREG